MLAGNWCTFGLVFSDMKLNIVDAQNAVLSGGVAVGAIADLVLHPYGAIIIGSCAGMASTIGYQIIQVIQERSEA